jgi:hypothetical protein
MLPERSSTIIMSGTWAFATSCTTSHTFESPVAGRTEGAGVVGKSVGLATFATGAPVAGLPAVAPETVDVGADLVVPPGRLVGGVVASELQAHAARQVAARNRRDPTFLNMYLAPVEFGHGRPTC